MSTFTPPFALHLARPIDPPRYRQAIDYLYGRLNYERTPDVARSLHDFKLMRMERLLKELGNPQLSVPTVHIAGSKGKGSTATMIARIAQAAGYRVGLFTSPHVERFEERFTVNGNCPEPDRVAILLDEIRPIAERFDAESPGQGPTFFELATAMSWLHFAREKVDLGIMEVGLGGRLDSTNVCNPQACVITSISRDHIRLLGDTLEAIAREKAGIIKPGVPVVSTVLAPGPAGVIAETAASRSAPLFRLNHEFQHHSRTQQRPPWKTPACHEFDFHGELANFASLKLGMPGAHQTRNAAAAVATVALLGRQGFTIPEAAIRDGLASAKCSLRLEVVRHDPLVILDVAHNPASITALCDVVRSLRRRRRIAIFGTSRDKETSLLLEILNRDFDEVWLTRYSNNPRSLSLNELSSLAKEVLTIPWRPFNDLPAALACGQETAKDDDLICVTGSFFLAAEAKTLLGAAEAPS